MLALAEHYEGLARELRTLAARLETAGDLERVAGSDAPGAMRVGEAVRYVLARADGPLRSGQVWEGIQQHRLSLATRSENPRKLIDPTLQSMERAGQVRKVPGGWELIL